MSTKSIGNVGENVACRFIDLRGFRILARNYAKKWGELDIVALKDNIIHFFEVKSVTYCKSDNDDGHKAEENVHAFKVRQIRRMIETYLIEKGNGTETEFQFHVLCVFLNVDSRRGRVKWIKNVIL